MEAKPHAVCIPFPVQGHINPMLDLAKLLHATGFHITFVNTEYAHRRLLHARGPAAVAINNQLADFRFRTIPDGLPLPDPDSAPPSTIRDAAALCTSTQTHCLGPFRELLAELNRAEGPPVSCVVADGLLGFAVKAAKEVGVPGAQFWTASASNFVAYLHYPQGVALGLLPFTDETVMDTPVDWMMGMEGMRLKDLPFSSFHAFSDTDYTQQNFGATVTRDCCTNSSAIIFNTNRAQEGRVLDAMAASGSFPRIYPTGPLSSLLLASNTTTTTTTPEKADNNHFQSGLNLWNEDPRSLQWLDRQAPGSVVYVNIGSVAVITTRQLQELAWGLASCEHPFLWVMRSDAVAAGGAAGDDEALLSAEFYDAVGDRGMVVGWCAQRLVLSHPAVGVFLTHCGWNSVVESVSAGVPMVCWPFFGDQLMNCRYACAQWGIGVELPSDSGRKEIGELLRGVMEGEEGRRLRRRAMEWKKEAAANVEHGRGLSWTNFNNFVNEVLLGKP